jgi:DNA-binding LytR/AlgR family response regulator
MKILIVDDEPPARRRLAALVEEIDAEVDGLSIEIVGEAEDGIAALEIARTRSPEVLLLDIAMPEVDGLDVVRHLPEPRPLVIFQTAYEEYALEAFEHEALDYVVKPVRKERLAQALERARARLAASQTAAGAAWAGRSLGELGAALGHTQVRPARLLVRDGPGHRLFVVRDVIRFAAAEGLVRAFTNNDSAVTDYTLAELESRLGPDFVRVSRAELAHAAHVSRVLANGDGSATLVMTDGSRVHVTRRRAADVRRALES